MQLTCEKVAAEAKATQEEPVRLERRRYDKAVGKVTKTTSANLDSETTLLNVSAKIAERKTLATAPKTSIPAMSTSLDEPATALPSTAAPTNPIQNSYIIPNVKKEAPHSSLSSSEANAELVEKFEPSKKRPADQLEPRHDQPEAHKRAKADDRVCDLCHTFPHKHANRLLACSIRKVR
jgi:hypothetical protein